MPKFTFEQVCESIPELGTVELIRLKLLINKEGNKRADKTIKKDMEGVSEK